jgi:hypothetical protein
MRLLPLVGTTPCGAQEPLFCEEAKAKQGLLGAHVQNSVEKTPDGWRIRKVMLDPIHYRGNPVGQELLRGKTLV